MERVSRATLFMSVAVLFSKRTTCLRGSLDVLGGSCLVQEGRIVSVGYAGSPRGMGHCIDEGCEISPETHGCVKTLHSEANCILSAAKVGIKTGGGFLYTTISPCLSCAKVIISAGINSVTYLRPYRDFSGVQYLLKAGVEVYSFEKQPGMSMGFVESIVKLQGVPIGEC